MTFTLLFVSATRDTEVGTLGLEGLEEVVKPYMKQVNTKESISILPFSTVG